MHDIILRHLGLLRRLMLALAVAALAVASPWPLEAQQRSLNLSFLGSTLSSDIPDHQTEGSRNLSFSGSDPLPEALDTQPKAFRYARGSLLAANAQQTKPAAAAAGGKSAGHDDSLAAAATNPISNLIQFQLQNVFVPSSLGCKRLCQPVPYPTCSTL